MPIIETANVQQVLQMSTHVEKLQQNTQQQPSLLAQQLEEDRDKKAELKRIEVQENENSNQSERSNPDGPSKKRRLRITRNASKVENPTNKEDRQTSPSPSPYGRRIDLVI